MKRGGKSGTRKFNSNKSHNGDYELMVPYLNFDRMYDFNKTLVVSREQSHSNRLSISASES